MNAAVGGLGALAIFGLQWLVPAVPPWAAPVWLGGWIIWAGIAAHYQMWKAQRDRIHSMTSPGMMTMKELFFHIDPEPLLKKEEIGEQVLDALSTGRLCAYGKEIQGDYRRLALTLIAQDYWRDAEFTYWFLDGKGDMAFVMHVSNNRQLRDRKQYADLRVERASALRMWPKKD